MKASDNKDQAQKLTLYTSVRELVEYALRSGDLNLTFFGVDRTARAIRAHQSIQASRPREYRAEVFVRHAVELDDYCLNISGRIDGIYDYGEQVVIDEIKTTRKTLASVQEGESKVHWGQAKCYAYFYALEHGLSQIDVQLTYYQVEDDEKVEIRRVFSIDDLDDFFKSVVNAYLSWARRIVEWKRLRDESIGSMEFPYEQYRDGQQRMMDMVLETIDDALPLLIQAPTGIGKTMAVIFPAVQALARHHAEKVFYLTARTTGRSAAEQCLETLRQNGLRCKYLSITAKEKICFSPEKACDGEDCMYARGFYDRINGALLNAFDRDRFTRDNILDISRQHKICPFEFSLELSLWVDVIICDYNYFFDPRVYLRRFFEDHDRDYVVLVDEAHNLVERSREMYSATILRTPFVTLRRRLRRKLPKLYRIIGKVNASMVKAGKQIPEGESSMSCEDHPLELCQSMRKFTQAAEQWLSRNEPSPFREEMLSVYFDARRFLNTADRYGLNYATCYSVVGADLAIKLFCMDPSDHLTEIMQRCRSAVFFSATLSPIQYFARLFGCGENCRALSLPSPFPGENLCVLVAGKISALYKYREFTKHEVARMISVLIDKKSGNYLIFFPSYEYMRMVLEIFRPRRPRAKVVIQNPGMSEPQREAFLRQFSDQKHGLLVGFAVMGGFFAESIDLVGERLTGAVVVGVGFPQISLERELIKAYFDNHDGSGFAFAYQIPGMIKVLQAAGRVIRSEYDRGVVLLIDTRYTKPPYNQMLPEDWNPMLVNNVDKVNMLLQEFWDR